MSTQPINASASTVSSTAQQTNATSTRSSKDVGADAFLKLLVEQLKNQDPLAPQDGAQFVAQLAQFNSLEQLISINGRLGQLLDNK